MKLNGRGATSRGTLLGRILGNGIALVALDIPECLTASIDMLSAACGFNLSGGCVIAFGRRNLRIRHALNEEAGLSSADGRLLEVFEYEPMPPHNAEWDVTQKELDEFCF